MYHFFSAIRKQGAVTLPELKDREFSQWLVDHPEIFEKLVFAGRIHKNSLAVLHNLWSRANKNLSGPSLNLALGASMISNDVPIEDIINKYDFYESSHKKGKLFSQFDSLDAWEMGILLSGKEDLEDMQWGQDHVSGKPNIKAQNAGDAACGLIPYRDKNKKGVSIHTGAEFYDHHPITLKIYTEYGGVCGAVSKGACGFLRSKGIPAYAIGQPGHCAFIWKTAKGPWRIGNNIYGWNWSNGGARTPWSGDTAIMFSISKFCQGENASASNLCYYLALLAPREADKLLLAEQSLKKNIGHVPAWETYASLKTAKYSESDKIVFLQSLRKELGEDPHVLKKMVHLLIPAKLKKKMGYDYCAFLLTEKEAEDSCENYIRELWPLVTRNIPALRKGPSYNEKSRKVFFKKWKEYFSRTSLPQNTRQQVCQMFEKVIPGLLDCEKTCTNFLDLYLHVLSVWKDRKMISKAETFIFHTFKMAEKQEVIKRLLAAGVKLGTLAEDQRTISKYTELMTRFGVR